MRLRPREAFSRRLPLSSLYPHGLDRRAFWGDSSMNAIANLVRSEGPSEGILGAGILLLPVQFADRETNRAEKRLMLAVLTDAVTTFLRHLDTKTRRGQRLFREAEEWIQSEDMSWTFAFENVCQTVGLDRLKARRPASRAR